MTAASGRQGEQMVAVEWEAKGVFTEIQALSRQLLCKAVDWLSVCGLFIFSTINQ